MVVVGPQEHVLPAKRQASHAAWISWLVCGQFCFIQIFPEQFPGGSVQSENVVVAIYKVKNPIDNQRR